MSDIRRPSQRTLYEVEGATGDDVWEVPPSDPSEAADLIAEALAAEEHRQGLAYGDEADHCGECAAEARRRQQAECEHDGETVELTTLCDADRQLLCQRCGAIREVSR